jgi:hypothetical protein
MDFRRAFQHSVFIFVFLPLMGCTAATPTVSALGGNTVPFSIAQNEIIVDELSDLNSVIVTARCYLLQTQFNLEFPLHGPAEPSVTFTGSTNTLPFTNVVNSCRTNQTLQVQLNLNGYLDFSSIIGIEGASRTIRFSDQNVTGLTFSDDVKIVYSTFRSLQERFIFGQGNNNTICQGGICLKGRVVNMTQSEVITDGDFTLKGRVVYQ